MSPSTNPLDEYSLLLELVEFAVRKEQEAAAFYRDLISRIDSESVRQTLEALAAMEDDHRDRLERLNVAEVASSLQRGAVKLRAADYEMPGAPGPNLSRRQMLEIAIGREIASWKLYSDMAGVIPDSMMKQLLGNLANEETRHREQLERLVVSEG